MTEPANSEIAFMGTPEKKNYKSITYLKSEVKKQKTASNLKNPKSK